MDRGLIPLLRTWISELSKVESALTVHAEDETLAMEAKKRKEVELSEVLALRNEKGSLLAFIAEARGTVSAVQSAGEAKKVDLEKELAILIAQKRKKEAEISELDEALRGLEKQVSPEVLKKQILVLLKHQGRNKEE